MENTVKLQLINEIKSFCGFLNEEMIDIPSDISIEDLKKIVETKYWECFKKRHSDLKMNNSYLEVKNYIHNELDITKDYIKEVIIDTVNHEIIKLMKDEMFLNKIVHSQVRSILNQDYTAPMYKRLFSLNEFIYDNVCQEISKMVSDNIKISVDLNLKNLELKEHD